MNSPRPRPKLLSFLFVLLIFARLSGQEKEIIAVLDFDAAGISSQDAKVLTNRVRAILVRQGLYTVIDRGKMQTILEEQDFQQTGCVSDECVVEVGALLGASIMMAGSIGKFGSLWTIEMRLIDVATSRITRSSSYDIQGAMELLLTQGIPEAVKDITAFKAAEAARAPVPAPTRVMATLTIDTQPTGALILLDDQGMGPTPLEQLEIEPNRTHTISLSLAGHQPVDTTFLAYAGAHYELSIPLAPLSNWLTVLSTPAGARVLVNSLDVGITPLNRLEVPSNVQYALSLQLAGHQQADTTYFAEAGGYTELNFSLKSMASELTILTTPPGARVLVDGQGAGTTPLSRFEVAPNKEHALSLKLASHYQVDTTFFAEAGGHIEMNVPLSLLNGALTVQTVPDGALVLIDGREAGSTPLIRIEVGSNVEHSVTVQLAGYQQVDASFVVEPGGHHRLTIPLKPVEREVAAVTPPPTRPTEKPEPAPQPTVAPPKEGGGRLLILLALAAAGGYYAYTTFVEDGPSVEGLTVDSPPGLPEPPP